MSNSPNRRGRREGREFTRDHDRRRPGRGDRHATNTRRQHDRGGRNEHEARPFRHDGRLFESRPYVHVQAERWTIDDLKQIAGLSSEEALRRITSQQAAFLNAFEFYPQRENYRVMKYLIKILHLMICTPEETDREFASRMLSLILSGEGKFASFCVKLNVLIKRTMFEQQRGRDDRHSILFYLIQIGKFCIDAIPQSVVYTFPLSDLKYTIDALCEDKAEQDFATLKAPLQDLEKVFTEKKQEIRQVQSQHIAQQQQRPSTSYLDDQDPPDNFQQIEILPNPKEIENPGRKPFLRTNLVGKEYRNWDHYLDVQFRLLREDFVGPLRKGIECFVQSGEKSSEVLVYEGVHVLAPVCLYSGIGFQIQFDIERSHLSRVRWEHSRRLIFGSLLCLSRNNFKDVLFATIVNRDVELLSEGKVTIRFESGVSGFHIKTSEEFLMVESTAYFEAYRHVLERLQQINADQMPFKSYILGGFKPDQAIPLPRYCKNELILDLNKVLELKSAKSRFDVKDIDKWPHHELTCLDQSQIDALRMALTQEVSVIQGPPGTGKTYIGLKIVECLLRNRHAWDPYNNSPILVVCYTNHALDQFLEGIRACQIQGKTPKIVRVGGRCKSEQIKDCALANVVKKIKEEKLVPGQTFRERKHFQLTIKEQKETMEAMFTVEDVLKGKILSAEELGRSMSQDHYQQLMAQNLCGRDWEKEIEVWLGLWFTTHMDEQSDDMTTDEKLATALAASLQVTEEPAEVEDIAEDQNKEDQQLITVEDEPQLLEQDRLDEGEQDLLTGDTNQQRKRTQQAHSKDHFSEGKQNEWQVQQLSDRERRKRIVQGMSYLPMNDRRARNIEDIWKLDDKKKWQLYHYWFNTYIQQKKEDVYRSALLYQQACDSCHEIDREINILALKGADIVGMTTTGAAKHSYILNGGIHPKVVIIEEAAEVFESHVVTSLCPSVEQLVLIGDHKQLRPKPNCYELGKKYLLDISLFERLARCGLPLASLTHQHRMRPEIASIVASHIYDKLENAPSVYQHPSVLGIGKNLFFIDHNYPERANPTADQRSHSNLFESQFLVALCRYLLKQDYNPTQITLLTMYRGQLIELKQRMRREEFEGIRVAAVDDFQGEENDIILLSLVRSNSDGKIGFLKIENRICVALSRARCGMYVIGNLSMLRNKDDTKWPAILNDLERNGFVGTGLPLSCNCEHNTKEVVKAETPEDFAKRPEGGCGKICGYRLPCGHACRSFCHPIDKEHKRVYKCHRICNKPLQCGHYCQSKCYKCIDGHPSCTKKVNKIIPSCKHTIEMDCGKNPIGFPCPRKCEKYLDCGDPCQELCSMPCTKKCEVTKSIPLVCGHTECVPCFLSKSAIKCSKPCKTILDDCGHQCTGTCDTCHKGRLHVQCQSKCGRTLSCGHICTFPCTANCPPCTKPCSNYCSHSKCPKLCYEPCAPCMEPCEWKCPHFKCQAPCGSECRRPICDRSCQKKLKCGHQCIGVCGEKCPTLCGVCNEEEVREFFFGTEDGSNALFIQLQDCKHVLEVSGLDYWMGMQSDENTEEPLAIKLKECPKCKTPIMRSLRYGNIVKAKAKEIEEVKKRILQGKDGSIEQIISSLSRQLQQVETKVISASSINYLDSLLEELAYRLQAPEGWKDSDATWLFPHHIETFQNQIKLVPKLIELFKSINSLSSSSSCMIESITIHPSEIKRCALVLVKFLIPEYLSDQQLNDAHSELRRLLCLSSVCTVHIAITRSGNKLTKDDIKALGNFAQLLIESGHTKPKLNEETQKSIYEFINGLRKHYDLGGLTDIERLQIVKAIGLPKGHWYKCRNGHIYCIGECGGAMETSKCPDCKATIGGTNYILSAGNVHAPEMDGSRHPA